MRRTSRTLTRRTRRLAAGVPTALALVAAGTLTLVLALAGCGGSSGGSATNTSASTASKAAAPPAATPKGALALAANPAGELRYDKDSLTAHAGAVTIAFTNMAPLGHNVTIENSAKQVVGATPTFQGGTKLLTLHLKPGVYKFFCSVPGHRMAGMEGTLTVR